MSEYKSNGYLVGIIQRSADASNQPDSNEAKDYLTQFRSMESVFYSDVHPYVDMGLAMVETAAAAGDAPNVFTTHGCRHVVDLIKSLDKLAESLEFYNSMKFTALEAYILLCSAHVHDAANVDGRSGHPQRCDELLEKYKTNYAGGTSVVQSIYTVASAHGGTHELYEDDTFRAIASDNIVDSRLPLLAALLRIGDELSENEGRVAQSVIGSRDVSGLSVLSNAYAKSFARFEFRRESLKLVFSLWPDLVKLEVELAGGKKTFLQFLEEKINKIELEARYCSQYGRPVFYVSQIDVVINEYLKAPPSSTRGLPNKFSLYLNYGYPKAVGDSLCRRSPELRSKEVDTLDQLYHHTSPEVDISNDEASC